MLQNLLIKNYALIQGLEISPSGNFNIITGETGAGKSIMLGAVGLLLGKRADTKALLDHGKKCIVEAIFQLDQEKLRFIFEEEDLDFETNTIIRREITPTGKSRAFVNDTPVNLEVLRKLGDLLVDIHSQHDHLLLGSSSFQLNLVDSFAQHQELLSAYHAYYNEFVIANKAYEDLLEKSKKITKEEDYIKFQLEELIKARLTEGEQEQLEEELKVLENAESIKGKLYESFVILDQSEINVTQQLQEVHTILNQLIRISDKYASYLDRINNSLIELKDVANELDRELEMVEFNPQRINEIQDRIGLIYQLQSKYQVATIKELLAIQDDLDNKVFQADNIVQDLEKAEKLKEKAFEQAMICAKKISSSRSSAFPALCDSITKLLFNLGMEDAQLIIDKQQIDIGSNGIDDINLLFSANKGISPQPLKKVASGGEFSRLLFCIKYILAQKTSLPTMIFDEIDTGISGEIAIKMARMMKEMAQHHQVIAISHLPQFAAKGDQHYYVFKDNSEDKTISKIKQLNQEERITEIAKMIGGDQPTATAYENARELMSVN